MAILPQINNELTNTEVNQVQLPSKTYKINEDVVTTFTRLNDPSSITNNEEITIDDISRPNISITEIKGDTTQEIIEGQAGTTITDTEITINDIDTTKEFSIDLLGNTKQETTTGKNKCQIKEQSLNGITSQIINGKLKITGTATSSFTLRIMDETTLNGTYTFSCNGNKNSSVWFWNKTTSATDMTLFNSNKTKTYSTDNELIGAMSITNGQTYNELLEIMIEPGSTASSYEKYTGGVASPNPSYPSNVSVVTGDNEVNIVGANILSMANVGSTVKNGITYTITDNVVVLNGTSSGTCYIGIDLLNTIPSGTIISYGANNTEIPPSYSVSIRPSYNNSAMDTLWVNSVNQTRTNYTLPNDMNKFYVVVENNKTLNNFTLKLMANVGTTAISYQPYTSQNYPLYLGVENKFNASKQAGTYEGSGGAAVYTVADDGLITQSASDNSAWSISQNRTFYLDAGTYTFSLNVIEGNVSYIQLRNLTDNVDTISISQNRSVTFTLDSRKALAFKTFGSSGTYPVSYYIQIEEGSKANSYSQYGKTPIELCKIGDYQDYLYKSNNKWYKHSEIGKVVLEGTENWYYDSPNKFTLLKDINMKAFNINTTGYLFCDYYTEIKNADIDNYDYAICRYGTSASYNYNKIVIKDKNCTSTTKLNNKLSTNNVSVYYVLATPTNTEITDTTLISQLEALKTATSYTGQTNISQINNDTSFLLKVHYNYITAAPSPDRKSDVQVITGANTLIITNKNLFDGEFLQGARSNNDGRTIITSNKYIMSKEPIFVKPSSTYKIKTIFNDNTTGGDIQYYDKNMNFIRRDASVTTQTVSTPDNCYYINFQYYNPNGITPNNVVSSQVEKGSTATPYVKHQGQKLQINLGNIELCKIGNYQDYIYKNGDIWYLHKEIGKVILDGSENWYKTSDTSASVFVLANVITTKSYGSNGIASSSHYKYQFANKGGKFYFGSSTNLALCMDTTYTLETFKTWLNLNNVTVYYVLATPTDVPITDTTLLGQLDILDDILIQDTPVYIYTEAAFTPYLKVSYYSADDIYFEVEEADRIEGYTEGLEAIKQAIYHILATERYAYLIYDDNYGVELEQYIGKNLDYIQATIEQTLKEALTYDLRIYDVQVTNITKISNDIVLINFIAYTIYGNLVLEVNVNV